MARRVTSPKLVGRSGEMEQLLAALAGAESGEPALLVIEGEAGIGKSRLVAECGTPDAAGDVVQEAFVRLFRETDAGRPPRETGPWLRQVAQNLVISDGRRATVRRRWEISERRELPTHPSPEQIAIVEERDRRVRSAMTLLDADSRRALNLAAAGYSAREIGTVIGRTEGATRTLLCRARHRLRADLAGLISESAPTPDPSKPAARPTEAAGRDAREVGSARLDDVADRSRSDERSAASCCKA
jgi:RNA polymerase sigma factor (sigma-70 family)